jgi:hypothetical protein
LKEDEVEISKKKYLKSVDAMPLPNQVPKK